MREDIAPEIEVDKVGPFPTREDMPDWWNPSRPPEKLLKHMIYKGRDGIWRDMHGVVQGRAARRRAGVR